MEPKREKSGSWRHNFEEKILLLAFWGHLKAIGMQTLKKNEKRKQKLTSILRPFRGHFEVLGATQIALIFCCFFWGSFEGLVADLGRQKASKEGHWKQFWSTLERQVEMWKLCSRADGSMVFEVRGGRKKLRLHNFLHFVFSMRFGRHFLRNLADLGSHWGPLGDPLGALLGDF